MCRFGREAEGSAATVGGEGGRTSRTVGGEGWRTLRTVGGEGWRSLKTVGLGGGVGGVSALPAASAVEEVEMSSPPPLKSMVVTAGCEDGFPSEFLFWGFRRWFQQTPIFCWHSSCFSHATRR